MTTDTAPGGPAAAGTEPAIDMDAVLAEIRRRRLEFEVLRHVPQDVVRKLQQIGCYRAFVPREFGGDELSPADFCRLLERIAVADASTAWVASFGVSSVYLAGLPPERFAEIYGNDPDTVFAGALFPPQPARTNGDVLTVSGRWNYCSGVTGASLVGVGVKVEGWDDGGLPRMAVLPRGRVTVDENWDTIGLVATGSHDVVLEDAEIPRDWTFVRGGKSRREGTIFRYPSMAIAAQVLAVVGLGTAREALDVLAEMAGGDGSITGAPLLAKRAYVQAELARGEAALAGARGFFYDTIEDAWQTLLAGDELSQQQRIRLRLGATSAAHAGAEVARAAYVAGGTRSIVRHHPLGRAMNDAAAVAQHAFLGLGTWESAGGALLNQPGVPGYP
ncbi:alkylation response protein AidB-like acyl-CoA dehydrogenase [Pseudochelatococcus lubricantis]|uniref:Alkylation response protein AidB-like acyl-CoA dehydrogenase n=1 Tax=Pseudochelatococcus lubricantis TaxID=1538102 RepID=A0ABX0V105_9HYPH|nr:acyl-CoA dehydrogenase family protein [Pseudochelatococcus lubricantis]NIJ58877.1 alkylation response protein AidB-like acyl-CoA dehydrogenase [Pseudochelatococcus lubricantis]